MNIYQHPHTRLIHKGRNDKAVYGSVNPSVTRASTLLFPTMDALKAAYGTRRTYGRHGNETTWSLEAALCEAEGVDACLLTPSGLSAITTTLLSFLKPGDHLLMTDGAYDPTRHFCDTFLKRMGIQTTYYAPTIEASIETLIQPNTRLLFIESPSSLTFEIQNVQLLSEIAHRHNIIVVADTTWATPIGHRFFEAGIDISIHSATKYIVGHSDVLMGAILTHSTFEKPLRQTYRELGLSVSSDDAYLALRGLRTLAARLMMHRTHTHILAEWLLQQPEIAEILYPPLPQSPYHELWKTFFIPDYACGLMGIIFDSTVSQREVEELASTVKLFGIGFSWGGYESLFLPTEPSEYRSVTHEKWKDRSMARIHVGLESPEDLITDLTEAFQKLRMRA